MFSRRMVNIVNYLSKCKKTSYKDIANTLDIKERHVRYDIYRINDELMSHNYPPIEKRSKGILIFPDQIDLSVFSGVDDYLFVQEDRVSIIRLTLLLNSSLLNLNQLANELQVSRSTIKNDLNVIEDEFDSYHIKITYSQGFILEGEIENFLLLLYREFKRYCCLFFDDTVVYTSFELKIKNIIRQSFNHIDLDHIIHIVISDLSSREKVLSDHSFEWYLSNILITIWSTIYQKENVIHFSDFELVESLDCKELISKLEKECQIQFSNKQKEFISRLLNYTSYHVNESEEDVMQAEAITFQLIDEMSEKMDLDFKSDEILIRGLTNHIAPLIRRIGNNLDIHENIMPMLSSSDIEIYEIVSQVISNVDILKKLRNQSEITYLTIHFIASIRRIREEAPKRVLLVCGFGYGTTTMLKESLINEFQLQVTEVLPLYRLSNYQQWDHVDLVITTTELDKMPIKKPIVVVTPILTDQDIRNIIEAGIPRKKVLTHYFSINRNLEFLNDQNRLQVLQVIRNQFGYPLTNKKSRIENFSDMLSDERISIIDGCDSWVQTVRLCTDLLAEYGYVDEEYGEEIIASINKLGYYSISDDHFALLHGKPGAYVKRSGMSLILSKKPIRFGEKQVNIMICLASKDNSEHIPALISLVRMVKEYNLMTQIKTAKSSHEIMEIIKHKEKESLKNG
ncbi:PTS transporter subunit EIIA [Bacillus sp. WMMC1349]|uniref:BglG family transcription antiterminator n=1 Tax=Bacillus sp. WMMC1349 TaxID=2736254 RepID=UPI00155628C4|nr:PTS sugar transporter subunit IIA [Bacillus sp. WMMC1349]NPC91866.1 PTS transporter subunit EIIA [Bacillus sp. WMMC1349]